MTRDRKPFDAYSRHSLFKLDAELREPQVSFVNDLVGF
jgi:hypothetical protein